MDFPSHLEVVVDYEARAHQLGIHLSPASNWPFVICFGGLFLALAAIPFSSYVRIVLVVIGGVIFLWGIVGWVVIEDTKMYPSDSPKPDGEVHH